MHDWPQYSQITASAISQPNQIVSVHHSFFKDKFASVEWLQSKLEHLQGQES